ncbi:DUF4328 domain-containing protein [Micromonospora inositola]|uniref:DUF4328 domain-containing protein n=1 Tax=Micromonospora inositola TaxID=47865 RepID=A0A1C5H6J6_9ACTN|nr:DUF4328 domain-containing protein [Micromonospora inositola]SCG41656.1 protein of unknown function [Micromonospora inositola]
MRCQICGAEPTTTVGPCPSCGTSSDRPALSPGMPTYPVRGTGLAAAVGVGLTILLYTLVALSPAVRALLSRRAGTAGDPGLEREVTVVEGLLSLSYLVVFLTTAVLVMLWMFRARKNTDAFPGVGSSLAPHWAITGWWVPVASLGVPCVVMAGIVRDSLGRVRLRALVALWWVGWLAFGIADLLSNLGQLEADVRLAEQAAVPDFDHYREAALRNSVPVLACLVAGVSLIVLILRISAAQQERISRGAPQWPAEQVAPLPPGQPAPQPVTEPSPQVPTAGTVASPPAQAASGGTIGA